MTEAGRRGRWTGSAATDKIESPGGGNAVTGRASLKFRVSSWDSRSRLDPQPEAAPPPGALRHSPRRPRGRQMRAPQCQCRRSRSRALTCQWLACQRAGPARH